MENVQAIDCPSLMMRPNPSSWFTALCSVEFDLKLGQRVEHIVPSGALTAKEQSDVAFHTFPDSMSQELRVCASVRDSCFFFRTRRKRILYGFVFCRQRQDERLVRGVDRRAVVVVTPYPFSGVLRPLSTYLGAVYFAEGTEGIERVYEQLLAWPVPQFFRLMQLRVAGHVIRCALPPYTVFPPPAPPPGSIGRRTMSSFRNGGSAGSSIDLLEPAYALFSEVDVYSPFRNVLSRLWSLWELTLTGQPLVIVAPSPVECSAAVAALISLISPVPYASDFRPYFTIHDPEFASLLRSQEGKGTMQEAQEWNNHQLPTLLGVTNLYFIKVLPFWPNLLSIGERQPIQQATPLSMGKPSFKRFSPKTALQNFKSRTLGAQVLLSHHVENLWSSGKLMVKPDVELCREISFRSTAPSHHSDVLRRHFSILTAAFLEPFRGYFVPVKASDLRNMDNGTSSSSLLSLEASGLPEFDRSEFLASILEWPFPSLLKNRFSSALELQSFYEAFLDSPNFKLWFERQQHMIAADLGLTSTKQKSDLEYPFHSSVTDDRTPSAAEARRYWDCADEVKLVEEFRRLQAELMNEMHDISPDSVYEHDVPSASEQEFILVFSAMPDDLRRVLLSSPAQFDFVKRLQRIPGMQDYLQDLPEFVL